MERSRTQTSPTRILISPTRTPTTPTRSTADARETALARTLEPVSTAAFLAETWEQQPLHVARGEPGRFDDLLSWEAAEALLTAPDLRHPAFRLVRAGEQIPLSAYTEDVPWRPAPFSGTADVRRVAAEWERGATAVLQGLHLTSPPIAAYCRALEDALGHPVQTNAYLTPRNSQGLPVHHDTHDVFVLQVAGRKRWRVYEPVLELPLKHQRYTRALGEPGPAVLDMVVGTGDTLYLPRGWLHEALTSDEDSLHLTVGVNVVTWLDALRAALDRCEDDLELRRSLPADGVGAEALLGRLAERLRPDEVATCARARLARRRRAVLDGQLSELRALDTLDVSTVLERRPTVFHELVRREDGSVGLAWEERTVWFPAHAAPEVQAVASSEGPFRAEELDGGLDEAGRLVLVRRLVREGFLRRAGRSAGQRAE